jgi:hypothetical protein
VQLPYLFPIIALKGAFGKFGEIPTAFCFDRRFYFWLDLPLP